MVGWSRGTAAASGPATGNLVLLADPGFVTEPQLYVARIDAKPPRDATRPGGNAIAVDWAILDGFEPPQPWLLAGGLHPGNVAAALQASRARAVDVSSGVEAAPGKKDPALIRAFIRAVHDFDASRVTPAAASRSRGKAVAG